jgi:hypothetical protein
MTKRKTKPKASSTERVQLVRKRPTPKPPVEDDGIDPVLEYARAVVDGKEVAGPYVKAACARHLRDLEQRPARGLKWDLPTAKRVIAYFPTVLKLHQ